MTQRIKVYHYPNCSTCKKALSFLKEHGIAFEACDISMSPPTSAELRQMIEHKGGIRPLFNTSGQRYREGGFAARIPEMSAEDAIRELSRDGMLVKRPFVVNKDVALVGFKPEEWQSLLR